MEKEMMVGGHRSAMQPQAAKKPEAVIARLPVHVKSVLMLMVMLNSLIFILFGIEWLGIEDGMAPMHIAGSAMCASFSVIFMPLIMWFVTRTDWGQRGGS